MKALLTLARPRADLDGVPTLFRESELGFECETASGPTPNSPPEFAEFLAGIEALQRLQDRKLVALYHETSRTVVAAGSASEALDASAQLAATNDGNKMIRAADGSWTIYREDRKPVLRVGDIDTFDEDFQIFCRSFKLNPNLRSFALTTDEVDPFYVGMPAEGLPNLDLETRSLLQVLSLSRTVSTFRQNTSHRSCSEHEWPGTAVV